MIRHKHHRHFNNLIFFSAALAVLIVTSLACNLPSAGVAPVLEAAAPAGGPLADAEISFNPQPAEVLPAVQAVQVELPPTPVPVTPLPGETATASPIPGPTATLPPIVEVEPVLEQGLYTDLTIASLRERSYGGGQLQVHQVMSEQHGFTRYLISYPSDGLTIYGFMNVPTGSPGPFPVVIALHGYIDPAVYRTLDYTTGYADTLARAGFLVLHPNLRNYSPSDPGENLFRVGMAVDVLNLIGIVKENGGIPGPLELAWPDSIGLWGHSMGGGISLRVSVVSPDVRAAVLYGAMSGDERQNFEAISGWSNGQRGQEELLVPVEELQGIAPIHFLDGISARLAVHHGESDQMVPLEWSLDLCRRMAELGKPVECFSYPGQRHTFNEQGSQVFMERVIEFYERELR
jgi:uncharacterized protein